MHYPIPQIIRKQPLISWQHWPEAIDPAVMRWKERLEKLPNSGNQLYVHVPFCPFYCPFCPLYKTQEARHRNAATKERYIAKLLQEIERYGCLPALQDKTFKSLYFGGGTPTQLTPAQLGRIVDRVRSCFSLDVDAEITLEGVATQMISPGYLEACVERGFNRISFGVQSLDPVVRQRIGRGEKLRDYDRLIELVRDLDVGLPLNVDLMIGLPGQDLESHDHDITAILEWRLDSVDIYSYWMVPGTKVYDNVVAGMRQPPRYGEALLEMRRRGQTRLLDNGFRQISGDAFVRSDPDMFIQTTFGGGGNALNTLVGFGPSAIGFVEGTLYQNVADLETYMNSIDSGHVPLQAAQRINIAAARRRAIMLGLQRLNVPHVLLGQREKKIFEGWGQQGLVELHDDVFRLTHDGALWFNQMQLSLLSLKEQRKLIGLLGTPRQQMAALSRPRTDPDDPIEQLLAMIRDNGGISGQLRVLGYKTLLRVMALPLFDHRAMGFTGHVSRRSKSPR